MNATTAYGAATASRPTAPDAPVGSGATVGGGTSGRTTTAGPVGGGTQAPVEPAARRAGRSGRDTRLAEPEPAPRQADPDHGTPRADRERTDPDGPDREQAPRRPRRGRETPPDDDPPAAERPARGRVLRIGAALVALLVFVACASGFSSHQRIEGGVRTVSALDPASDAISNRSIQAGDQNVLVLGLPPNRGAVPEPERTDTAVLVHLPAGGGQAVTLGIPPTLEVPRPPCQRWDPASGGYGETVPAESRTAFSAAFDVGGPRCTVGVVQQLTGLAVTRFVAMDMSGTAPLVNAVRGVGVCTERPVVDRALGPVVARPGDTVLGGSEAERFAAANGVDDLSPADRVRRQQRVLSAVLGSALSTPSLLTPGASDRVSRALPAVLMSDGAGVDELLVLSGSLSRTSGENPAPQYLTVPVNDQPNTRGHLELRSSDASDLFSAMRKHEPLPEEVLGAARLAATTQLPAGTVVDVLNAAGRPGLAAEAAGALRAQGYLVGAVRDADPTPDSLVRFSPDRAAAAGVVAGSVPGTRPEPEPTGAGRLELVLGASFPGPASITPPARAEEPAVACG